MSHIKKIIKSREQKSFIFKPGPEFYKQVGINSRRWARIYRDELEPTISEAKAIATYFEVDITELI